MVQDSVHHLFFRCNFVATINDKKGNNMKKILFLIASIGLLMGAFSCSNNDEPKRGDGVFTVNSPMVNHLYDTSTGNVLGIASTFNKLTLDTVKHTASLELRYNDGSDKTLNINNITARAKRLGFYELSATPNGQFKDFKGYVDFNESSIRYTYTTADGIRVISTISDVFFLKTDNVITYPDTTKDTHMQNVMYQFEISPASSKAVVKVMGIVHAKELKYFISMTANSVPFTTTATGYSFDCVNVANTAIFRSWTDSTSTAPTLKTSDKYPFKYFKANLDLVSDSLHINFTMGDSASVVAKGCTYPDYTAY